MLLVCCNCWSNQIKSHLLVTAAIKWTRIHFVVYLEWPVSCLWKVCRLKITLSEYKFRIINVKDYSLWEIQLYQIATTYTIPHMHVYTHTYICMYIYMLSNVQPQNICIYFTCLHLCVYSCLYSVQCITNIQVLNDWVNHSQNDYQKTMLC